MLKLNIPKKPYWIDLGSGVRVKVRPLTTPIFYQARAFMEQRLREVGDKSLKDKGVSPIDSTITRQALSEQYLTTGLARAGILEWKGILEAHSPEPGGQGGSIPPKNTDKPAPCIPEKIDELFDNFWAISETFRVQYTGLLELLEQEKNALGLASDGTSETGQAIAKGAKNKASPARKAKREKEAKGARTQTLN